MIGSHWGGEGCCPFPPRPPLTRIFMRGSAPQTPHRFNGYTPPTWIRYVRKYSIKKNLGDERANIQYQKKPWRSMCEYTCIGKNLGDQRANIHVSEKPSCIFARCFYFPISCKTLSRVHPPVPQQIHEG